MKQSDDSATPNIKVKLFNQDSREINSGVTDEDGKYWFEGVSPGKYIIVPEDNISNADIKQTFKPESQEIIIKVGDIAQAA